MRLPVHKLYRAFRELDRFSDLECERYMLQIRVQLVGRVIVAQVATALPTLVLYILAVILTVRWLNGLSPAFRSGVSVGTFEAIGGTVIIAGAVALPALAAILVRDRMFRTALRNRLDNARCTSCRFSLLGLPVSNGMVRCPECGVELSLAALGLKPEEIQIRQPPSPAS